MGFVEGPSLAANLAQNLRYLRSNRGLTQSQLAERAELPRSTLANIEADGGNPTLSVLSRLAGALQITIQELLSAPRASTRHFRASEVPTERRGTRQQVLVRKLLPDPIPGMEFERLALPSGGRMRGVPHRLGTREYLYCDSGEIVLWTAGQRFDLAPGDLVAFQGDLPHSYGNEGSTEAVGFSVVAVAPP